MDIDPQFQEKAFALFHSQQVRERERLKNAVPKGVPVKFRAEELLPYTRDQFCVWLWDLVGMRVIRCPYCLKFIDIGTLVLDHKIALALGGSPCLENQEPTCQRCNLLKNELYPEEFRALMDFLRAQSPHLQSYVESCMLNGPKANRLRAILRGNPGGRRRGYSPQAR